MKPIAILLVSGALGAAGGALTATALAPVEAGPAPRALEQGELDALRAQVRALKDTCGGLQAEVRDVLARGISATPAARAPEEDLEAVVRRYFEEHHPELAAGAAAPSSETPSAKPDVGSLLAALDLAESDADTRAVWERARKAGLVDELVAAYERRAEERPNDPDAQVALGSAYLHKLEDLGDGPEKGAVALQADRAFDRALELDPRHWEARFTKAVSLSFWPPLFGKQAEAIRQFEVLAEQQQSQSLQPHFAATYELLGNLYQQTGQSEKAHATWRTGAQLFPDSTALQQKLE